MITFRKRVILYVPVTFSDLIIFVDTRVYVSETCCFKMLLVYVALSFVQFGRLFFRFPFLRDC